MKSEPEIFVKYRICSGMLLAKDSLSSSLWRSSSARVSWSDIDILSLDQPSLTICHKLRRLFRVRRSILFITDESYFHCMVLSKDNRISTDYICIREIFRVLTCRVLQSARNDKIYHHFNLFHQPFCPDSCLLQHSVRKWYLRKTVLSLASVRFPSPLVARTWIDIAPHWK